MKIYTKTGDNGTTGLIGGARVAKDDSRIEAYGALDELSAHLGLLHSLLSDADDQAFIERIQSNLFVIGSHLASDPAHPEYAARYTLAAEEVTFIEHEIDKIVHMIPPQSTFLLPGGCHSAAQAHVSRTVCRRAERRMVSLNEQVAIQEEIMLFINRLSDYLYVLARKSNFHEHVNEKKWQFTW